MFKHYLLAAFKFHISRPLFAVVSIIGLAIGFACCFMISLYVMDELSFDKNLFKIDQLYRVSSNFRDPNGSGLRGNAATTPLVGPLLVEDFNEVELQARLHTTNGLLRNGDLAYYETQVRFIDTSFFELFNFTWLAGNSEQAMALPNSIVLTESLSNKYFGNDDPLGKVLLFENKVQLVVTGLLQDLPDNTHLSASAFVTIDSLRSVSEPSILENWNHTSFHTYLRLKADADINNLQQQLPAFLDRHYSDGASKSVGLALMKASDIHLQSAFPYELSPAGSMARLYVFSAVSLCILIIASINFMNLALATATQRSKEVGLRKTLGAQSSQIVRQLLGESFLLTTLAAMFALALVELVLPAFNAFTGKQLNVDLFGSLPMLGLHVLVVMAVALCSGIYPALFQAAWKPSAILKGVVQSGKSSRYFRNSIIVLQFAISITLITVTLVIYQQLDYADHIEQGYHDDQMLILDGPAAEGVYASWQPLRQQLLAINGIERVAASNLVPQKENGNSISVWAEGDTDGRSLAFMLVDSDFFTAYDIELLAGRYFSREFPNDVLKLPDETQSDTPGNVIVNRTAVEAYGWTLETAIGRSFQVYHDGKFTLGQIVGVVEDSHFESLRTAIKPMVFILPGTAIWKGIPSYRHVSILLSANDLQSTMQQINNVWKAVIPAFPLQSHFLVDDKQQQYGAETRQGQLLAYFTLLSIFIAAIGLFALACWNATLRTREIGVRKVMGGTVWSIVVLLTNDFSKLVLIANVVAWPIAYLAMNRWLENFAYRIDLTPVVFIGSGLIALCIAWVTVGGTAAKAASQKPVLALRYE